MFSSLLEILSEYSLASLLIIISMISLYLIYFKPLKNSFSTNSNSSTFPHEDRYHGHGVSMNRRKSDLMTHEFFRNMDLKIGVELPLEVYSLQANRNVLLRDITIILFSTYRECVYKFIENLDITQTSDDLSESLTSLHFNILQKFEEKARKEGIPSEATLCYSAWFLDNVKIIHQYTNNICKSSIDTTIVDRVRTFLFVLQIVLINALTDLQNKPCINGSLNGITYNDLIIEDN